MITVLTAAGCGDSALSPSELRSRAGAFCQTATVELAAIPTPASPNDAEPFVRRGLLVLTPEYDHLIGLNSSGQTETDYRAALTAFDAKLRTLREAEHALLHGADPTETMKALEQTVGSLTAVENSHWQALDIPACFSR